MGWSGFTLVILCWVVWLLPNEFINLLLYDRAAIVAGQYWRLWTAHLTHFTVSQLIIDTAMLGMLSYALKDDMKDRFLGISICFSMPIILVLQLWLVPNIQHYRGASSLVSMMWVLVALLLLQQAKYCSPKFWLALTFLSLLFLKIWADIFIDDVIISELPKGVDIAWQAHIFGAISGLMIWLSHCYCRR